MLHGGQPLKGVNQARSDLGERPFIRKGILSTQDARVPHRPGHISRVALTGIGGIDIEAVFVSRGITNLPKRFSIQHILDDLGAICEVQPTIIFISFACLHEGFGDISTGIRNQ